jgi:glycosyltransferase involved in cell wall biosynthesis
MKICFIMPHAYPPFIGIDGPRSGGEVQMARLASELNKRGYSISLICFVPIEGENKSSIRILKLTNPRKHLGRPRLLVELLLQMKRANADIFITRNLGRDVPFMGLFSRLLRRRFLFCTASNGDFDGVSFVGFKRYDFWLWKAGLRFIDQIIVQTEEQKKMLWETYGVNGTTIPNGINLDIWKPYPIEENNHHVLWIGYIRRIKRFDRLIEIAMKCPEVKFTAIGFMSEDSANLIVDLPRNVKWVGNKSESAVQDHLRRSALLLNTSDVEGLSNAMIEAWATGRPVFSMGADVDGTLASGYLGKVYLDESSMASGIQEYLDSSNKVKEEYGNRAIKYVEEHYSITGVVQRWENLLTQIVEGRKVFSTRL